MAEVIKMPRLSATMEEGVVSQWLKKDAERGQTQTCTPFVRSNLQSFSSV